MIHICSGKSPTHIVELLSMKLFFYSIAIPIGVMLSPETLVLLGNSAGYNGMIFFLSVAAAAVVCCMCAYCLFYPGKQAEEGNELSLLAKVIGRFPAAALVLSARLSVTLLVATSVLVTAGFAFNEIFVYWFPNFGFAFLLLGFILVFNIIDKSWAAKFQLLLMTCTLLSFSVLLVAGLVSSPSTNITTQASECTNLAAASGALLLFLGFDLIINSQVKNKLLPAVVAICTIFTLFILWGAVSRAYVPFTSLIESTLPHLKAARAIMGQNGRLLMGVIVICGATAAVNGLFLYMGKTVGNLAGQQVIPRFKGEKTLQRLASILMAVAIGILMMSGLAGEDKLSIYYRGALVLWLVLLTFRCFTSAYLPSSSKSFTAVALTTGCIIGLLTILLVAAAEYTKEQFIFCLQVYICALLLMLIWPGMVKLFPAINRYSDKEKDS